MSLYFPTVIFCISVFMFESENTTDSDSKNLSEFKYTIPKTFCDMFETTLATALLVFPIIFSPMMAFVVTLALAPN